MIIPPENNKFLGSNGKKPPVKKAIATKLVKADANPQTYEQKIRRLRANIARSLKEFDGREFKAPTRKMTVDNIHNIDREILMDFGVLISRSVGLSSGNSGDFNLYKLLICYFQRPDLRAEINKVMER